MQVGFIGTGHMGTGMAQCVLDAKHELLVFDIRKEATEGLVQKGAKWADVQTLAATCEVIFTSLPGPKQFEEVALNKTTGLINHMKAGSALFDTTTNSPEVVRKVAASLKAKGIEAMDSPVSGSAPQQTMMVGGNKAVYEKYRPLLGDIAKNVFYVGDVGSGCIAKLATQYLGYTYFIAATEAFLMAAKAGVNIQTLAEIIPVSAGRGQIGSFTNAVFKRNFEGQGTLDIIVKDMTLACEVAHKAQSPAFTGAISKDIFERAQALGWGNKPFYNAVQVLEQMAGIQLQAPK